MTLARVFGARRMTSMRSPSILMRTRTSRLTDVRLLHEIVDQLDNGGVVDAGLDLVHLLRRVVGDEADRLHLLLLLAIEQLRIAVVAFDGALDVLCRGEDDGSVHAGAHLDVLDDAHVIGVGDGDEDLVVGNVHRHDAVSAGEVLGDKLQHFGTLDHEVLFHKGDVEALCVGGEKLGFVDDAARKQDAADVFIGVAALPAQRVAQLVMGDRAVGKQNFPNQMIVQANFLPYADFTIFLD